MEEKKSIISPFCDLALYYSVVTQCFLFLSSPYLSGNWFVSYCLLITNFKAQDQSHNCAQNSSVSHMSKICELWLADLPPQLGGLLQKKLVLEKKPSSRWKLPAILGLELLWRWQQKPHSDIGHPDANPEYDSLELLWMYRLGNIIWLFLQQGNRNLFWENSLVFFTMWELSADKLACGGQPAISGYSALPDLIDLRQIRESDADGHRPMKGTQEDTSNGKGTRMVIL